jgi:hypothetical protein
VNFNANFRQNAKIGNLPKEGFFFCEKVRREVLTCFFFEISDRRRFLLAAHNHQICLETWFHKIVDLYDVKK